MTKKTMRTKFILLFLAVGLVWTGSAAAINVPDGDFDDHAVPDGGWRYVYDVESAWIATVWSGNPWIGNNYANAYGYPVMGHTGSQYVDLNAGYIHQALPGETYVEGETYELSVWITTTSTGQGLYGYFLDGAGPGDFYETTVLYEGYLDVAVEQDVSTWSQYTFEYTASADDAGKTIGIGIYGRSITYADTVTLIRKGIIQPVKPSDGASNVPVSEMLEWTSPTGFEATGYDLYFGTEPNATDPDYDWQKVIGNQLGNSWDPPDGPDSGDMEFLTKYYWRVDVYEPNTVADYTPIRHDGLIWSFTTTSPLPAVTTHPQSQVAVGGAAEFTVAGVNIENYAWYMSVDDSTETPPDDIPQGSGPTMDTLTLSDVVLGDEGYYYCVVSNEDGANTDKSNTARLITERLVGKWTFDAEDYSDSSDSDNTGIPSGDPTFVAGLVGEKALELDGNDFVAIDTVANDLVANNVTLSAWVKTTDGYGELIACNTAGGGNVIMLEIWGMVASTDPGGAGTTTVNDDTWRLLTYVRNGSDDYIYVNGTEEYAGTAGFNFATDNLWSIGQEWDGGPTASDFLTGTVDDVRIYNYALPHDEVAQLYVDVMGGYVCKKALYYDTDGDCIVGISDFAAYAAKWMDCNFIPVEDCP